MKSKILAIAESLPSRLVSNEEIAARFENWTPAKIHEKLGISSRYVLSDGETPSDIAIQAALNLFDAHDFDKNLIDYIIYCSQSPDYSLPTTACVIHERLGLTTSCGAVDINQGCSGYIYGLSIAKGLIESGVAKYVLLLTSDAYSRLVDPNDPSVSTVFGDAATATLISEAPQVKAGEEYLGAFQFGTDGSGAANLIVRNSGQRREGDGRPKPLFMDGAAVMSFALNVVPSLLQNVLMKSNSVIEEFDFIVLHQANKFMLDKLHRKLKLPPSMVLVNYSDVGNTVSSTIPIVISREISKGKLAKGMRGILLGFGVGLSWGGCVIEL